MDSRLRGKDERMKKPCGFGRVPFQVVWTATGIPGRVFHPKSHGRVGGFLNFPSHFLPFQTSGLPRSVGQGLEFRKPGHLRTFPDIWLNQDLPDFGIFRMRPNHAARATTRVAPTSHPCPGHGAGAKSSLPGAGGTPALQFCRPVLVTPSELYERRGVMPHRYYGRGLLSEMTRGRLSVV